MPLRYKQILNDMNSINGELITRIALCGDEEDFEKMETMNKTFKLIPYLEDTKTVINLMIFDTFQGLV